MKKSTHSKLKNTGILFELLTRQITADTMVQLVLLLDLEMKQKRTRKVNLMMYLLTYVTDLIVMK